MAIRWRESDLKKLSIYVRKFNAAITRLEKNTPELADSGVFPQRLNVSELKSRILTRKDYNREMKAIDRFFKPGARDIIKGNNGYYTTKWGKAERRYLEQRTNANRKKFIEKYNVPKNQQASLGLEPISLDAEEKKILSKAAKLTDPEDKENELQKWYNLIYTLEREASGEYLETNFAKLRNSYFKAIQEHMPKQQADELIQYLEDNDVWGSDIVWAISQNDIFDFEFMYSLEDELSKAEIMKERWEQILPELKQQDFYKNKVNKPRKKRH